MCIDSTSAATVTRVLAYSARTVTLRLYGNLSGFHSVTTAMEMLRKAFLTGILMFFKKGSLSQLVLAMIFSLAFGFTVAWLRPFASRTANLFKV